MPKKIIKKAKKAVLYGSRLMIMLSVLISQLFVSEFFLYQNRLEKVSVNVAQANPSDPWYDSAWSYRRPLTLNHAQVPNTDQSNFPVFVSASDDTLKVGQHVQSSSGYDIIFTLSDGTLLSHELESYDGTNGSVKAWVKIPLLSYTVDTVIYMYYGNSSISSSQENPTGVWDSNFKGVWHMKENPSSSQIYDSTSNNHDGTANGGMLSGQSVAGQTGQGISFDGSNDYINLNHPSSIQTSLPVTLSAWIKVGSVSSYYTLLSTGGSASNYGGVDLATMTNKIEVDYGDNGGSGSGHRRTKISNTSISANTWIYVVATMQGSSNMNIYINGSNAGGSYDGSGGSLAYGTDNAAMGSNAWGNSFLNGSLDEVRLSNVARSADWIATEYHNQYNPASFCGMGGEEMP
jgi:hypothetical protein